MQALDSRYTSFSIYISIGLIGVCSIVFAHEQSTRQLKSQVSLITALIVLSLGAYSSGIQFMRTTHLTRLQGKAALLFANIPGSGAIYEACLRANQHDAKMFASMLNELGLLRPRMVSTIRPAEVQSVEANRELSGYFDGISCSDNGCVARGWAFLPGSRRTVDAVALSYGTGSSANLFQMTAQMHQRVDVAQLLRDPSLLESGWTAQVDRESLSEAAQPITAWAVDGETATLYELRGSATLP